MRPIPRSLFFDLRYARRPIDAHDLNCHFAILSPDIMRSVRRLRPHTPGWQGLHRALIKLVAVAHQQRARNLPIYLFHASVKKVRQQPGLDVLVEPTLDDPAHANLVAYKVPLAQGMVSGVPPKMSQDFAKAVVALFDCVRCVRSLCIGAIARVTGVTHVASRSRRWRERPRLAISAARTTQRQWSTAAGE